MNPAPLPPISLPSPAVANAPRPRTPAPVDSAAALGDAVCIVTDRATGMLQRTCRCLVRHGYGIAGNRIEDDALTARRRITVTLKGGARPLPPRVLYDLAMLDGCVAVEAPRAPAGPAAPPTAVAAERPPSRDDTLREADLLDLARARLRAVFGDSTTSLLAELAADTPPMHDPAGFIARCRDRVATVLGAAVADGLFESAFARLR